MTDPLQFVVTTLFQLYVFILVLRFVMQWVRADFYNPVSQFIVRVTTPVVRPLRRVIPGYKGFDLATLFIAIILLMAMNSIVAVLHDIPVSVFPVFIISLTNLISQFIDIFFFAILIQVILSWVNPHGHNPAMSIVYSITSVVLGPVQRVIPPMGGLDISPLFAMLGLKVLEMLINPLLLSLVR